MTIRQSLDGRFSTDASMLFRQPWDDFDSDGNHPASTDFRGNVPDSFNQDGETDRSAHRAVVWSRPDMPVGPSSAWPRPRLELPERDSDLNVGPAPEPADRLAGGPPADDEPDTHIVDDPWEPRPVPPEAADRPMAREAPSSRTELTHDNLTQHRDNRPRDGWRRMLYTCTGGLLNPGLSRAEVERAQLCARIRRPLTGSRRIAVISIKGGVSKTTTSACLGAALAEIRGDQVGLVDANPDAGTLADRLTGHTHRTIRDLINDIDTVDSLTTLDTYMSLAGRLKVLASEQDPAASEALTATDYEHVMQLLARFINIVITDTGTGISHPTMEPALRLADCLVVVGTMTVDGASRAGLTLDWLDRHGHDQQSRNAIVVLSGDRHTNVDADRVRDYFATRTHAVIEIPHDPHLAAGGFITFESLLGHTRDSYVTLAAHVVDRLSQPKALILR
ncbi:MinD/ParA family ATP-binding protein [Pseudonocardia sp. TRM90224]|uniref:MinD/ParA family ATP-binding protein n=1 Tax=Pseudonocardia sp. TRM90224 TaxID=2812678 RepID=UPI001E29FBE9|nr:MinD/ParA family protein [Pseudonocardia sp. TRM90224]